MKTPEIVCLCGSTRFFEAFMEANCALALEGKIVLSVGCFGHGPETLTAEQKTELDELHRRKIDLADRVLFLNVNGYMGESTTRELAYVVAIGGKEISFLEKESGEKFMEENVERVAEIAAEFGRQIWPTAKDSPGRLLRWGLGWTKGDDR